MSRSSELRRFFWEQAVDALGFSTWEVHLAATGLGFGGRQDVVTGVHDGLPVEVGAYWSGGGDDRRIERTFTSVGLEGLPSGLEIDFTSGLAPHSHVQVPCPGGESKAVTVLAVPVDLNGLHLTEVSIDLERYLTPDRRNAICNVGSILQWNQSQHLVRRNVMGSPTRASGEWPKQSQATRKRCMCCGTTGTASWTWFMRRFTMRCC